MSIKDFNTIEMFIPIKYNNRDNIETMATATIHVTRGSDTIITIPGNKHTEAFMEMILLQVMTGFTLNQKEPSAEFTESDSVVCMNHIPIQHRDLKEPWCRRCGLNPQYLKPRVISFGKGPLKSRESQKVFEETTLEGK